MTKKKALYFYSDIYHQGFYYLHKWTRAQINKEFLLGNELARGLTFTRDGLIYIWLDDPCEDPAACLAHECVHAANFALGSRGVKVTTDDDEAQAYLVQWIFSNCFKKLKSAIR